MQYNLLCMQNFTRLLLSLSFLFSVGLLQAQTVITQWNFNSVPPDASNSTGSSIPSTGAGTLATVGGVTGSFSTGTNNGGSSDPAAADNTGYQTTNYPAQGTGNKTAGIQFAVSTAGYTGIEVRYDLRHSNTSSRYELLQYTTDVTAATPVWVDARVSDGNAGDTWFNERSVNLSSVTALNNNPNAGFRIVAVFADGTATYAGSSSAYAASGTWRFDMVTVRQAPPDITPPVAQAYQFTSVTTSTITFNEPVTSASVTNLSNYVFSPSLAVSSATVSGTVVTLTHAPFVDGQPYTLTVSGVQDEAGNTMASATFNLAFNATTPNLVVTEIIHSPNDVEMIEVYNAGSTAVPLGGLRWTDGTTGAFPAINLAAGATVVFATSPSTASATLNVSPVYTINNGLASDNDILVIRNSLNQAVDSVAYFVGMNGWPTAPTGVYAYSYELTAATADNNVGSNWFVPNNPVVPQPSAGAIRATPGVYPTPPYTPSTPSLSFVGTKVNVGESTTTVTITANLQGGGPSATTVDLELLPLATATAGTDFTLPASLRFTWPAFANNVNQSITVTVNNDALPENSEYFAVRFINPVNTALPPASTNNFTVFIQDNDKTAPTATQSVTLNHIASFSNGAPNTNSAEIVAHDPGSQRLFIANSIGAKLDIVNFSNPASASLITSVAMTPYGNINSVAAKNGIVAVAIEDAVPENPGKVVFFDVSGNFISQVTVGAMPDMITFNNAGTRVLTANEGQPRADYVVDPEGSVSIIDISGGVASVTQVNVTTASFTSFNGQEATLNAAGVRIFGPGASVAQDIEPEYITLSADDNTAWVTCQENNAVAEINIPAGTVTAIRPLGLKDHSAARNPLDADNLGGVVQIANWPVKGLYMPDAVASYTIGGQTYLVTANEGDAREYTAYEEVTELNASTYVLDPTVFPNASELKSNIGRLKVTKASGDIDNDGDYDEIHAFGGRSFSIWNASTGALVWDSGSELEDITANHPVFGAIFNASNGLGAPSRKNRSDDKGPEPEGVVIAQVLGRTYAFIALERIGGCMVYDITDPTAPVYVDYKNTRNLAGGGDNGAEGIIYVSAAASPTNSPIVILANETSSTLTFYRVGSIFGYPLDINLAGIKATNVGSRNRVEWTTAGEAQGDAFEVQRSKNGVSFTAVASLPARGVPSGYGWWDDAPFDGITYYRLKLKHTSGSVSYSAVVSATVKVAAGITLYPNPVDGGFTVKLSIAPAEGAVAEILDAGGRLVRRERIVQTVQWVDAKGLAKGLYTLRYVNNGQTETTTFNKQ